MLNYILRRLLVIPLLLFGVSVLLFGMIAMMSPLQRAEAMFPTDIPNRPRDFEGLIKKFGLDDPIHLQYWRWMAGWEDPDSGEIKGGVLRGSLGWSQVGRAPVSEVIAYRLPASLELVIWSSIPIIVLGIWMGVKSASRHNKFTDLFLRLSAITGWSIPTFVFGLMLLMLFYSKLGWFPPGRLTLDLKQIVQSEEFINYTKMNTIDALLNWRFDIFLDALRHLILPIITLSVTSWAFLLRVTRYAMLETLHQDYITLARSKGISEKNIIRRHALPNALIPVITVSGLTLVGLFNGVVITEAVFNYPGLGSLLAEAAVTLDLVSVAGVTLFSSSILILGNLAVDVLYGIVDPRILLD